MEEKATSAFVDLMLLHKMHAKAFSNLEKKKLQRCRYVVAVDGVTPPVQH